MNQWKTIITEEDVYELIEKSIERPQIIFKDSVTCGISQYAKEKLTLGFDLIADKADFHYLDLLSYRAISNMIAQVVGVTHQSPQILILKDKKVVQMYSHHSIEPKKIATHLE